MRKCEPLSSASSNYQNGPTTLTLVFINCDVHLSPYLLQPVSGSLTTHDFMVRRASLAKSMGVCPPYAPV